jgi:O-antigen/teichoic acid export membrane protein
LPATQYLVAVNRQRRALAVVVVAVALGAVANHVALTRGHGLVGVAVATALSYLAYFVLAVAVSLWRELDRGERLRLAVLLAVTLVPTLCVAVTLERRWPGMDVDWGPALAKTAAVAVTWGLVAAFAWRRAGWSRAFRKTS